MRLVVDLDGVICSLKNPNETYSDVSPNKKVISIMKKWKKDGHTIIIYTARHMRTCNGDVHKVVTRIGNTTINWLKHWEVPYDEIYFGKPYGDIYIDDQALTYSIPEQLSHDLEQHKLNFVIPMAGKGSRFKNAGFNKPKFMIKTKGKTLFEWSLSSIPIDLAKKIIFVCLYEHKKKFEVHQFIKKIMKKHPQVSYKILYANKITRGQTESVFLAKEFIDNDVPLLIYNIDTYSTSSRLRSRLLTIRQQKIDGLLGVYQSNNPQLSYVKLNANSLVQKTAEKKIISNLASTGLYVFSKGSDFVTSAEQILKNKKHVQGEFFVSELYNYLIAQGKIFAVDTVEQFIPLGTPQDLKNFEKRK